MNIAMALDILVAVLLVATIAYAAILNRRLGRLRSGKAELEALLRSFQEATVRAEASIGALRSYADVSSDSVEAQRTTIKEMRDEIDFLVGRAGEQADRLEGLIREGRGRERSDDGLSALMKELRGSAGTARDDVDDGFAGAPPGHASTTRTEGVVPPWTRKRESEREGVLR